MLDKIKYITVSEKKYPMAFTLNVMESIQEKYGSMEKWGEILQPEGEEPKIKDLIWTFKEFINEGIDIENDEKEEKRSFITEKQAGRLISYIGLNEITSQLQDITVASTKTNNLKNVQTTQNLPEKTTETMA